MHIATFLQDLALIMIVAGMVAIIFNRLKQPVVLGYILAGVILGGHTPPFSFIHDEHIIKTLAELGVMFLMFSLGLEFNLRKLFQVGAAALVAAILEIILMIAVGYGLGQLFGWRSIDSLFLGAMLAISSTTIIIKALNELNMRSERFTHLIFGILIIEDILAIGIIAILSSIALSGSPDISDLVMTLGKLSVFLVASLTIGIFFIPKFLAYVAQIKSREMLLITVLGLFFGFSLLVIKIGYSIALGAFLIGAIIAEAKEIKLIEKLVEPLTNMFSAIFFVSIGLLVDPKVIKIYIVPIIIITIILIIGKVVVSSLGVFLAGRDPRTSVRVGMSLAQIGEFSFIIASLGISLKVMSPYLYPIIVAVSAITTFLTPYLIKMSDPLAQGLSRVMPYKLRQYFNNYTNWWQHRHQKNDDQILIKETIKKGILQILINLSLITAIFISGSYLAYHKILNPLINNTRIEYAVIWGISLILSLVFIIAIYRKLKGLSMLFAEIIFKSKKNRKYDKQIMVIISEGIPILGMLGIGILIILLSVGILPSFELLILVLIITFILVVLLWSWFIKFHSFLQIAFMNILKNKKNK